MTYRPVHSVYYLNENSFLGMDNKTKTLRRENLADVFYEILPKTSIFRSKKSSCINLVHSWIKLPICTLDIAFFDIFHKKIIDEILLQRRMGIRCRVILFPYMLIGEAGPKRRQHVHMLKKGGVSVRWCMKKEYDSDSRILVVDATDPEEAYDKYDYDTPIFIAGNEKYTGRKPFITDDVKNLLVFDSWRSIRILSHEFEKIWEDCEP